MSRHQDSGRTDSKMFLIRASRGFTRRLPFAFSGTTWLGRLSVDDKAHEANLHLIGRLGAVFHVDIRIRIIQPVVRKNLIRVSNCGSIRIQDRCNEQVTLVTARGNRLSD